jgi:hypothetical protein
MTEKPVDMATAITELAEAEAVYTSACQEYGTAERNKTAARARLNDKQKQFDAAAELIRSRTGSGTDWWRRKHEKPCPA